MFRRSIPAIAPALMLSAMLGPVLWTGLAAAPAAAQQFGSPGYRFLEAVRDRNATDVTRILGETPILINTREVQSGETALLIVTERRDLVWLRFLLGRGADANIGNREGMTPLVRAVQLGWGDAIAVLVAGGANVNASGSSGETALHLAVQRRDLAMVRSLIAAGANPDLSDNITGKSPRDLATEDPRAATILAALDQRPAATPTAPVAGPR